MTKSNGLPCKKCGTRDWYNNGHCKKCHRQSVHKWNADNYEKVLETNRQWKKDNPERQAEHIRRWQESNPESNRESSRRWSRENLWKDREKKSKWRAKNPEKVGAINNQRRTLKTQAGGSYTADEFRALCDHYGNRCLRCKRGDVKLTADHVKPVIKGGSSNIDNIQPLCKSCNSAKHDRHIDYRPDAGPLRWLQCKLFG